MLEIMGLAHKFIGRAIINVFKNLQKKNRHN